MPVAEPQGDSNIEKLNLQLLGEFSLRRGDGRPVAIASKKNRALLAILALSPGLHATREKLAYLLWGSRSEDAARNSLRQALAILRKEVNLLGQPLMDLHDDNVILRPEIITIDALMILNESGHRDLNALRAAASLYRGGFLADLALSEEALEEWLVAQRQRLDHAAIRLFDRLAQLETGYVQIETSQRLLALNPLREASHRQLMKAYAGQGEKGLALKQFDLCRKLLKDELGVEPATETQELRAHIANGQSLSPNMAAASKESAQTQPGNRLSSIAVLPFANLGEDSEQGYFCDGVTGDIIAELSRLRLLSVQSRSASFRYRGIAADIKEIARDLNVRYLVEGSVRRLAKRIRISVQLIDAETGNHVWAEKFDRELDDLFKVQDQVVRTIVSTLAGRVQVAAVEGISRKPPASLLAYECVLKGNALPWDDPIAAREATRLFARAVELDPGYGFAHGMLANMYSRIWKDDLSDSDEVLKEAYRLAKRAVELDSNDSTCFTILGQIHLLRGSFDRTLQFDKRAIEINPNCQWNVPDVGFILVYAGEAAAALDCFRSAKDIDPYFDPPWYWSSLGLARMIVNRHEDALAAFEHLPTRGYWVAALMAGCHASLADEGRAATLASECLNLKPDFSITRRVAKEPFKDPADATHLVECIRMAGLPE